MKSLLTTCLLTAMGVGALALTSGQAAASPISVNSTTLNIFSDNRGQNDIGVTPGDVFQFGADINGGSLGTSIAGIFTPTGAPSPTFMTGSSVCGPLDTNANFCSRSTPFSIARTMGSWQVEFENGGNTTTLTLPAVSVIPVTPVPFPSTVTITANGTTPNISSTLQAGTNPNTFRVNVDDKSVLTPPEPPKQSSPPI
jgi:hypothetical protein